MIYRVLFYYFDRFLLEYENRFEKHFGYLRSIIQEVAEKYLECGNPLNGFARIKCSDCGKEKLLMFSCKTRGFCPSCHAKRREEWGEWMREELYSVYAFYSRILKDSSLPADLLLNYMFFLGIIVIVVA